VVGSAGWICKYPAEYDKARLGTLRPLGLPGQLGQWDWLNGIDNAEGREEDAVGSPSEGSWELQL